MKVVSVFIFLSCLLIFPGCRKIEHPQEDRTIEVRTALPEERVFQDFALTQGVVEPVDQAVLSAMTIGRLEELHVKEGDTVKKGSLLFRSDRQTLENRLNLAQEMLNIAKSRLHARKVDLSVAEVTYEKASTDLARNRKLYSSSLVSSDTFETSEVAFKKAQLTIDQAKAAVAMAKAEEGGAEATVKIAAKRLSDSEVRAPYDGMITAKYHHENEYCNAGTPVLKIEAPGKKRIAAVLSGIHFPSVKVGKTLIAVSFAGKEICRVPVSIMPLTIDPLSRTFEIKGDLPENFKLPSGSLCDVRIIMAERKSPALPEDAVLFRQNGTFAVFEEQNGTAHELAVVPGATQGGFTEILSPAEIRGKQIIVSGQYFTNDKSPVRRVKE